MADIVRRKPGDFKGPKPEILAPAGSRDSFLAALAAGADAVYCGMKAFSARMAAKNFTPDELSALIDLAHEQGSKVYLTVNTLLTSDDLPALGRELNLVNRHARPDALIIQDLGAAALARQAGFEGELHLSTLANVTMTRILPRLVKALGVQRVVIPRELDIEEVRQMAAACTPELGLEIFVHGALCYGVSGRCYWSSYLGGKSGLRGRCVQPCRRLYRHGKTQQRFFACQDLSLDVLVKVLAEIPQVRAWKIEGRKKGPHYVYYTTTAYKMLRDEGRDPQAKKAALGLLDQALGRPGTHYGFLPQRPQNPIDTKAQSGSGLMVGTVRGSRDKSYLEPRLNLLAGDKLRLGYEDQPGHLTLDLPKPVPKGGKFFLQPFKGRGPAKGTAVFLIDRREAALNDQLKGLAVKLESAPKALDKISRFSLRLPPASPRNPNVRLMHLRRFPGSRMRRTSAAFWLSRESVERVTAKELAHAWWWLPPVIWPKEEDLWQDLVKSLLRRGAKRFVLNAPWQIAMFGAPEKLNLWAGPFCNIANPLAARAFKLLGGQGVVASPELNRSDLEALAAKSVLPLGIVVSGHWPLCVSRVLADGMKTDQPFASPRHEQAWVRRYGELYWIYPNWPIDLRNYQDGLIKAGYRLLIHLDEPVPRAVSIKKRPGHWNWALGLK
jgi:putative protease